MNRDELQKILAAQRARRNARATQPPAPQQRKRTLSIFQRFIWTMLILTILIFGVGFWAIYSFAKSLDTNTTTEASSFPEMGTPVALPSSAVTDPASVSAKVCTNIPDGRLHVRFTPGEGSEVRGYLAEGETVQIVLVSGQTATQTIQDEQWIKLLSPVEGWSNKIYICEIQK